MAKSEKLCCQCVVLESPRLLNYLLQELHDTVFFKGIPKYVEILYDPSLLVKFTFFQVQLNIKACEQTP